jgi:formylglycine-generating enzyme required for sulfatase activity
MVPVAFEMDGKTVSLMVSRYELTWREYLTVMTAANCPVPRNVSGKPINLMKKDLRDDFPMTSVSPADFECYINHVRKKTGKPYRLPLEAEWMAMARAASGRTSFPAKEVPPDLGYQVQYHLDRKPFPEADFYDPRDDVKLSILGSVGLLKPDRLGLFDMFGNAEETMGDVFFKPTLKIVNGQPVILRHAITKGKDPGFTKTFDIISDNRKFLYFAVSRIGYRLVYSGVE